MGVVEFKYRVSLPFPLVSPSSLTTVPLVVLEREFLAALGTCEAVGIW